MIALTPKTAMWIIPPEGPIERREVDVIPALAEMQEIVGGYIEVVKVVMDGVETILVCNEDGRMLKLAENPRALDQLTYASMTALYGTVVIFSDPVLFLQGA